MSDAKLFLDTNVLIENPDYFSDVEFVISDKTLFELEEIKSSRSKADDVRSAARKAIRFLNDHKDQYEVIVYNNSIKELINSYDIPETPDNIICACAAWYSTDHPIQFITLDAACQAIAEKVFGLTVGHLDFHEDHYTGFKEVTMTDEELIDFLDKDHSDNEYNLLRNQYFIVNDSTGEVTEALRWNGSNFIPLYKRPIKSIYFEKLKCKDIYQMCVIDSIMNCTITAISGKAGSGKSLMSLMAAMSLIESGRYSRLVVLFNPTKTRFAADMGYYVGSMEDKAMASNIGNILTTKFGDRYAVDLLLSQNRLKLVSMADCRGMEIREDEILYISESQNTSIELIKLSLSRVASGAKVIIEGDYNAQVDNRAFEGHNNGLKRVIDVFKGHEEFGYVELQNVWRSRIAELCELL